MRPWPRAQDKAEHVVYFPRSSLAAEEASCIRPVLLQTRQSCFWNLRGDKDSNEGPSTGKGALRRGPKCPSPLQYLPSSHSLSLQDPNQLVASPGWVCAVNQHDPSHLPEAVRPGNSGPHSRIFLNLLVDNKDLAPEGSEIIQNSMQINSLQNCVILKTENSLY